MAPSPHPPVSSSSLFSSLPTPRLVSPLHNMADPSNGVAAAPSSSSEQQPSAPGSVPASPSVEEGWSCFIVAATLCFFVSMTMILGVYASRDMLLGPNTSRLLQTNSFFVQDIEVSPTAVATSAPMLYGFAEIPKLEVQASWSETHSAMVQAGFHKEWIYYLNEGSQINISYSVRPDSPFPLSLVIAEGKENLMTWIEDPSYPNTTLSWNIIEGSGLVRQKIFKASDYYIAVGNLNLQNVEVELNFSIQAFMYNTTGAYYKCTLDNNVCKVKLLFMGTSTALLTTPSSEETAETNYWSAKVSYGPRWITYCAGSGAITVIILLAMKIYTTFRTAPGETEYHERDRQRPERAPLLVDKNDDIEGGSSNESVSNDEEEGEDKLVTASAEGKSLKDNDTNNTRRLCVICFDEWRDCFFLPCGHCAACLTCGTRIAEETGVCPICRRKIKVVRKIITV